MSSILPPTGGKGLGMECSKRFNPQITMASGVNITWEAHRGDEESHSAVARSWASLSQALC